MIRRPTLASEAANIFAATRDAESLPVDGAGIEHPKIAKGSLAASHPLDILVVDDNEPSRALMRAMLASYGYKQVRVTANGSEALAEVRRKKPDCVLLDLIMPVMDGFTAAASIREFEDGCEVEIYIAAISAHFEIGIHQACAEAGMNGYLLKPFLRAELELVLYSAYARRENL